MSADSPAPGDLVLAPARGLPGGFVVPAAELVERFSRSSGPGGQSVNTSDTRVELRWDVTGSAAPTDAQRQRLLTNLGHHVVDGEVRIVASEHRSQHLNRVAARARMSTLLRQALAPPPPERRATGPSRRARARRVEAKRQRGELKVTRRRPPVD